MKHSSSLRYLTPAALGAAALLASCTSSVPLQEPAAQQASVSGAAPATAEAQVLVQPAPVKPYHAGPSAAANPRAYRADAAQHIYAMNSERIWKGRLPPLLYAIGVLQVEVDNKGDVRNLSWMRAPKHAPEVIAEIRACRRARKRW